MLNQGTLIAAAIRPNDSADQYPVALQAEIKGGAHSVSTIAEMNAIGSWLREEGMTCYVGDINKNTYQLAADLETWNLFQAGGGGDPGSGGDSADISLLSGNFGAWTPLGGPSGEIVEQVELKFKTDLSAFPSRVITYLQGQFALNGAFSGTTITLGNLPASNRPAVAIQKYFIVANIEMYLSIGTNGDVVINSKDGINLPVDNADEPYYIDTFFQPDVATVYTATRTESFTRNNCASGSSGSSITYSQNYTSTVDRATADAAAAADSSFETTGQDLANSTGTCTVIPTPPTYNFQFHNGSSKPARVVLTGAETYAFDNIAAGANLNEVIGSYIYDAVFVYIGAITSPTLTLNGVAQAAPEGGIYEIDSVAAPIILVLT